MCLDIKAHAVESIICSKIKAILNDKQKQLKRPGMIILFPLSVVPQKIEHEYL